MIGTRQSANPARNGAARSGASESGAAAVEVLMAMAMALLFTLFLVNALLMLYARSVLQHAADIGARNGARSGGTEATCEIATAEAIERLAALYADSAAVECSRETVATSSTVTARLEPVFSNFGPDWDVTVRATSSTELVP
ncbi:MAG: pilus assembly protein [bacterium]|nr:pilus assembly protein [bacterium]